MTSNLSRRAVLTGTGVAGVSLLAGPALARRGHGPPAARGNGSTRSSGRGDGPIADVRVVHAIPDAPPVDVAVGGDAILDEFPFGSVSSYVDLRKGTYDVEVTADLNGSVVPVFDQDLAVAANTDYTVAATGTLADDGVDPELVVFSDDDRPAPATRARIRVVHLSPDAGDVAVELADGTVLIPSLSFWSASDYLTVPGGTYDVVVRQLSSGATVGPVSLTVPNGYTATAFALGLLGESGPTGFTVAPTVDAASPAVGRAGPTR